jgi:hypothetical protein
MKFVVAADTPTVTNSLIALTINPANTPSTSTNTGVLVVAGGVGIKQNLYVKGIVSAEGRLLVQSTASSTSTTTGALQVQGGAGIGGNLYVGGPISGLGNSKLDFTTYGANTAYLTTTDDDSTALFMGAASAELYAQTNILIRTNTGGTAQAWTFGDDGNLTAPGKILVQSTESSTSTISGALTVAGGVGINGSLYVANTSYIDNARIITTATIATYASLGPTGNTGTQGIQGIQGTQGIQGVQGIQGIQGLIENPYSSILTLTNTTRVFSTNSGALQVSGGVGVGGGMFVGGVITATNVFVGTYAVATSSGGISIGKAIAMTIVFG